jgi:hypothetical protein
MHTRKKRYQAPPRQRRVVNVHFKLTPDESKLLEKLAAQAKETLSAYLRRVALEGK